MTNLFEDFSIGSMSLKNRIVMAPMTRNRSPNTVPGDKVVDYYRRRAAGGVGLILTEASCIGHKASSGYPDVPFIAGKEALAGWQKVVDAVHAEQSKIACQLWHVGGIRRPGIEPGGDLPGYSPSGMALPGKVTGHSMTKTDITEVIDSYAQAAANAERVGFDGIEIHAAHGYLIDQFFWEGTNRRDDEYGGSLENRLRFAVETITKIRENVSADFPVFLRFSQWKQQDYTARLAETSERLEAFLTPLANAGVDVFHCSQRRFWEPEFQGSDLNLAGWAKRLTGKPSVTVGSVGLETDFLPEGENPSFKDSEIANLENLNQRLAAQEFDLVAVGRAMIANPDWAQKVANDKLNELRSFDKSMLETLV